MQLSWSKMLPASLRTRLSDRQNLKKILANTGWLLADRVLRLGLGLIVGVWIARYLGPEQYGLLNFATAFVALFAAVTTLGLDTVVVRDIVKSPEAKNEILGTAFVLRLGGTILILSLCVASIFLVRHDDLTHWLVLILSVGTIFQTFDLIDLWFQSQLLSKYTVYAKNSAYFISAAIRIALIIMGAPVLAFALVSTLELILCALGLVIVYQLKKLKLLDWKASWSRAKDLLGVSWPLMFSSLAVIIFLRIDQFMLGQIQGDKAVGIYSAAVKLAEVWYFIPLAIISSVFPSIVSYQKISQKLYYERLQNLFSLMVLLSYLYSITITFSAGLIVNVLYGADYRESQLSLILLAWNSIFMSLGSARETWMVNENLTKLSLVTTILGATCNIGLNLFLIPLYGPVGAAIATLIAQVVMTSLSVLIFKRTRGIFPMQVKALLLQGLFTKRQ